MVKVAQNNGYFIGRINITEAVALADFTSSDNTFPLSAPLGGEDVITSVTLYHSAGGANLKVSGDLCRITEAGIVVEIPNFLADADVSAAGLGVDMQLSSTLTTSFQSYKVHTLRDFSPNYSSNLYVIMGRFSGTATTVPVGFKLSIAARAEQGIDLDA